MIFLTCGFPVYFGTLCSGEWCYQCVGFETDALILNHTCCSGEASLRGRVQCWNGVNESVNLVYMAILSLVNTIKQEGQTSQSNDSSYANTKTRHPSWSLTSYEGWNFNFGNTQLDWIQVLLEWCANAAGRMGPSPTYIHNGSGPSWNGHTQ